MHNPNACPALKGNGACTCPSPSTGGTHALTTPAQISAWRFLSRMHQLALELNTPMKSMRMPILKALFMEGLIDVELRGTRKNKKLVLEQMIDVMNENDPNWEASESMTKALAS